MEQEKSYPIGIQDFSKIRNGNFIYIDKTKQIAELIKYPGHYFLSRPRRFGKSLLLSTLQYFFEGKRELFKGLYIDSTDVDWTPRPVIKLSFNTIEPVTEFSARNYISGVLKNYEECYGIYDDSPELGLRLENLLNKMVQTTGQKVVILIDEYDAPLLNTLNNETLNRAYRATLKSVFSVLKSADELIHFALITGVSRFSHTSLFSGANNLKDISFYNEFAAICGITQEELTSSFMQGIHEFADAEGVSDDEMVAILKHNYDGYHFSKISPDIYNPFSLLCALDAKEIKDFWFQSGTPTYLIDILNQDDFYLPQLDCIESVESDLSAKESYLQNPIALLFEAGYITIRHYDKEIESYILALPNQEVATSFTRALIPIYSQMEYMESRDSFMAMRRAILLGKAEDFMSHLQTFLAGNPYSNTELAKREKFFKNNIFLIFRALGFQPRVEEETCNARMDVLLRTRRFIYIFELKTDSSAQVGMNQIADRNYAAPYADDPRKLIKIAANYSSRTNNIDSWTIE